MAMDLFRMKYAKLGIYYYDPKSFPRTVTRFGIVNLRRDYPLLNDELTPLITKRYTNFFVKHLTEMEGIDGESYREDIEREILRQAQHRIPTKPLDRAKLLAIKTQPRSFRPHSLTCLHKAYPGKDDEEIDFIVGNEQKRQDKPPETGTDEDKAQ